MSKFKQLLTVLTSLILLGGCSSVQNQYDAFIEEKANVATTEESTTASQEDIRSVPEFVQIEDALKTQTNYQVGNEIYRLKNVMKHSQEAFDVVVREMAVFEASSDDAALNIGSNGAIVLMNVAITNKTTENFYFSVEELRLNYLDALVSHVVSQGLYPAKTGNLAMILESSNNGELTAGSTVEGYLVYALSEEDLEGIKAQEAFYLTVVPPRHRTDELVGLSSNNLGSELPLYLPISATAEENLIYNQQFIQDRLTAEWWGIKTLLAEMTSPITETTDEVKVTVKNIEITNFVPHTQYEESFQYFPNGQVIVTVEFEIENQSTETLLSSDSIVNLTINGDIIQSEDILINQTENQKLLPNEKATVIKTFALDKMTYQQNWQKKDITMAIDVPVVEEVESTTTTVETSQESEEVEETTEQDEIEDNMVTLMTYHTEFVWSPNLLKEINDKLELVDELMTDEITTEATTTETTSNAE